LHPSGRNGKSSGRSSEFEKIPVFQYIRPDDVVIPSGRHSVPAATVRTMCDPARTPIFMVRTIKLHIWKLRAPVQPSGRQPLGCGRSEPYYGNYVQSKCNRPDARATPSGRGLVMEAFSATLERRLQLIVRTLGQAVWTTSGILVITFYSNIGLGRNQRHWKANKKLCNLSIRTASRSVRTVSVRMETSPVRTALQKIPELLSGQEKLVPFGRPWIPSGLAYHRTHF
jgi:hypothetical protein